MNRKVLLVEPNYKNKYPPMPLMKLATYFRRRGDDVRFFKGDLKTFAAHLLAEEFYTKFGDTRLARYFAKLETYLRLGKTAVLEDIPEGVLSPEQRALAKTYHLRFKQKDYPKFDMVCVTTLFTFYWAKTIDTINFCKHFLREGGRLLVGGVAATILPDYLEAETGVKPFIGLLNKPGKIDAGDPMIIDTLPLDYSILEEIDYKYPAQDAYFGYMTRGCIRNCPFCAVKTLEPTYKDFLSIKEQIAETEKQFGAKRDLLLMDNNVLASPRFADIIAEIKAMGFQKGARYTPANSYDIALQNLRQGHNVRGYLKKMLTIYEELTKKLPEEEAGKFYLAREEAGLLYLPSATREAVLRFDAIARPFVDKHMQQGSRMRALDFNQGLDARLATDENMHLLAQTAIRPLRIAFDHYETKEIYVQAITLAAKHGIKHLSNYLLYNYKDKPEELYYRMELNVCLCEQLGVSIYSFPMKYHPIRDPQYFRNRNFIGEHWNRKFIRAVQAVLNATKGKIGRGKSFFEAAFGKNLEEYQDILWMPEDFIIEREKYKHNLAAAWQQAFHSLTGEAEMEAKEIIAQNQFTEEVFATVRHREVLEVLGFYKRKRRVIKF